jgi:hypothetical protein
MQGPNGVPSERARFIELRKSLAEQWQPQNGIEWRLIDQMTQAQTILDHWMYLSYSRATRETREMKRGEERWELPRVQEQDAQEFAAEMVDRWQRMFLRTVRALRDLRRYQPQVIVQNAGQVNIGSQQVNVAQNTREPSKP